MFKACFLGLLFPFLLNGQETGLLRIAPDRAERAAEAAVWGGVEEGYYKPTYAPVFQWSAGADARVTRHGKTSSWTGALSLKQATGNKMYSSMFLEPEYYPFDILEFDKGTKSRQDFRLDFGYLSDFGYEWAAGLRASIQGAHVAKRQDIPHSSSALDVRLEPVLTYVMDDEVGFASAYRLCFRNETLRATGDADRLFLDEGMRYGTYEVLEGNGAFPVREMSHGLAAHLYSEDVSAGLNWTWKRGQAGASGLGGYKFPGSSVSLFYEQVFQADQADHVLRASYGRDRDQLRSNGTDGITAFSDRLSRDVALKYEVRFLHGAVRRLGLALDGHRHVDRALYPRLDQVKRNLGSAALSSSFSFGPVDLDLEALVGGGLWRDRGRSKDETTDTSYRRTEDWLRLMDYYMAPRVGAGGALTYHFSSPKGLYVRLDGRWLHALRKTATGGQNREIGNLTVGYDF